VVANKKPKNYINNGDLTSCIVNYQKNCKKAEKAKQSQPTMPKYIGQCIMKICNRLTAGKNFNFASYSYRDEMIADAIERCCYAVLKFDATRANAFSYLTTVAVNAQKKRINDEKKQNYTKHKYFRSQFIQGDVEGMEPNELSDKVITDFEQRQQQKKDSLTNKTGVRKMRR
jgi:hypothetical protein